MAIKIPPLKAVSLFVVYIKLAESELIQLSSGQVDTEKVL